MEPIESASGRPTTEQAGKWVLGVLFLVACGDGGMGNPGLGDLSSHPNPSPEECQIPLDCPDRECLVVSGCVDSRCRYTPVFFTEEPIPCSPRNPCFRRAFCSVDGQCVTDEDSRKSCDDENPCTQDSCDPQTGSCVHAPLDDIACDDWDPCTEEDRCSRGFCQGTLPVCSCVLDSDCPVPENRCIGAYHCHSNTCVPAPEAAVRCPESENPCQDLQCDPRDGACRPMARDDGSPCNDQDPCTTSDVCQQGTCQGHQMTCDDGDPCTKDSCDPTDGTCHFAPQTGPACDDGDPCTANDHCQDGLCQAGDLISGCCETDGDCNDGDPCTNDRCDVTAGRCQFEAIAPCCGNGKVEMGEECDDKNQDETDGCARNCRFQSFDLLSAAPPWKTPVRGAVALSRRGDRFLVVYRNWHPGREDLAVLAAGPVNPDGVMMGPFSRVNDTESLDIRWPAVVADRNGDFLVAWRDQGVTRIRRVLADGTPVGAEKVLEPDVREQCFIGDMDLSNRTAISMGSLQPQPNGDRVFLVAWMQDNRPIDVPANPEYRIWYALFRQEATGTLNLLPGFPRPLVSVQANFLQVDPQVLDDGTGAFLLLWTGQDPSTPTHWENRAIRVAMDGTLDSEFVVREHHDVPSTLVPVLSGGFDAESGLYLLTWPELVATSPYRTEVRYSLRNKYLDLLDSRGLLFTEQGPSFGFRTTLSGNGRAFSVFQSLLDERTVGLQRRGPFPGLGLAGPADYLHFPEEGYHYGVQVAPHPNGGVFAIWSWNRNGTMGLHGRMIPP